MAIPESLKFDVRVRERVIEVVAFIDRQIIYAYLFNRVRDCRARSLNNFRRRA